MRGVVERRLRHRDRPKRSASDDSRSVCTCVRSQALISRLRECDRTFVGEAHLFFLLLLPLLPLNFAVRESNHRLHSHLLAKLGSAVQLCRSSRSSRVIEHCEREADCCDGRPIDPEINSRFAVCPGGFRHCCPDAGTKFARARAPKVLEAT